MSIRKIMVNGLPGNVARIVADYLLKDERFELVPHSLTGPEIQEPECIIDDISVKLIQANQKDSQIRQIKQSQGEFLTVDFTHPSAVNPNADFYCRCELPFVMGTTGGDRRKLQAMVESSSIAAVIAPNMAKQIVGLQAMMEYAADNFPNLFKGYALEVKESHQQAKADTSGTAKAMVGYFNKLGVPYSTDEIVMVRDPQEQKTQWGIPEEYLAGHGWHTYTLVSEDQTVQFEFTHNVNGRKVYVRGTVDAILYLSEKVQAGARGKMFTMIDVLQGS